VPECPNVKKRDLIHKAEVHNIEQLHRRRTEPRQQGICTQNFVKIGPVVPEVCSWRDKHTYRQTGGLITILCTPTGAE